MFLTSRIIRSKEDTSRILKTKMTERKNFIENNVGSKETQDEFINSLKLKTEGQ